MAAALLAAGCAKQEAPPGALPDNEPPGVRSLYPAPDTVVPGLSRPLRIRFEEPIQGTQGIGRQLVASPAYRYQVSSGHSHLAVEPEGGWRPNAVYVIEIPAGISDLLGNRRQEPIRVVFSTGPPIASTRVRAALFDRVTGEPVRRGRALFIRRGDTVPYTAVPDSVGRYQLSALPPGEYQAYGLRDRNRNLRLDRNIEPYDSASFRLRTDTSSATLRLRLLEPDSTPPRLARARARDSVTVDLLFDDRLRPGQGVPGSSVRVVREAGTGGPTWPVDGVRVLTAADTAGEAQGARPDTAGAARREEGPGAGAETAPAPAGDTLAGAAAEAAPAPAEAPARRDSLPLPTRWLRVHLGRGLQPDTYRVSARGVRNLWKLPGGGDTTFVYRPAPDTAAAGGAGRDTAGAAREDTARATGEDTAGAAAAEDTARAARDDGVRGVPEGAVGRAQDAPRGDP